MCGSRDDLSNDLVMTVAGFGEDGHVKSFIELAGAAVKFHNTGQWFGGWKLLNIPLYHGDSSVLKLLNFFLKFQV